MLGASSPLSQHIKNLQANLARENPILLDVVKSFRLLDRVAYRLGILSPDESFTTRVPWWPMISILGTFSSGKSTFINEYLGEKLQKTGNQAVDDKFTVLCYANEPTSRTLPGRALDADPRFPFYQMSLAIEDVAPGEGPRIDTYLQLKTCHSPKLSGRIFIDSPGFDADEQRNSTLRITDHIMDLSDLVLVFFDARHPEPGAMHDTLEHLVAGPIRRADSNKFLYVLNQIDNAAREDNPEEVFAAWQRALAQKGLTAGRFYSIYSTGAAITIDDPTLRQRFESKRDEDMADIEARLQQVEVERAYRIIGVLEQTAKSIEEQVVPMLRAARARWRRRVLWLDGLLFGGLASAFLGWTISAGHWTGLTFNHPWWVLAREQPLTMYGGLVLLGGLLGGAVYLHYMFRRVAARSVHRGLARDAPEAIREWVVRAFGHNVVPWKGSLGTEPVGWGRSARRKLAQAVEDADRFVQVLNSRFADPSGRTPTAKDATDEPNRAVAGGASTGPEDLEHPPANAAPGQFERTELTESGDDSVTPPPDYVRNEPPGVAGVQPGNVGHPRKV